MSKKKSLLLAGVCFSLIAAGCHSAVIGGIDTSESMKADTLEEVVSTDEKRMLLR